jgi:hypothetical protein
MCLVRCLVLYFTRNEEECQESDDYLQSIIIKKHLHSDTPVIIWGNPVKKIKLNIHLGWICNFIQN